MPDAATETIAAIALIGAGIAVVLAWLQWARLRATREQLALLQRHALEQAEKVERLGSLVAALRATVETKVQKLQISALERQVEVATAALKTQDTPVDLPRIPSIAGAARSAAVLGSMTVEPARVPPGALGKFRAWAGWGRRPASSDLGKRARKGPQS